MRAASKAATQGVLGARRRARGEDLHAGAEIRARQSRPPAALFVHDTRFRHRAHARLPPCNRHDANRWCSHASGSAGAQRDWARRTLHCLCARTPCVCRSVVEQRLNPFRVITPPHRPLAHTPAHRSPLFCPPLHACPYPATLNTRLHAFIPVASCFLYSRAIQLAINIHCQSMQLCSCPAVLICSQCNTSTSIANSNFFTPKIQPFV